MTKYFVIALLVRVLRPCLPAGFQAFGTTALLERPEQITRSLKLSRPVSTPVRVEGKFHPYPGFHPGLFKVSPCGAFRTNKTKISYLVRPKIYHASRLIPISNAFLKAGKFVVEHCIFIGRNRLLFIIGCCHLHPAVIYIFSFG